MSRAEKINEPALSIAQLLDGEEALAIEQLTHSLQGLGEGLCGAADLRARIRAHPFLASGLCAGIGFLAAPWLGRAGRQLFAAGAGLRSMKAASATSIPDLLLASLRGLRGTS
jgi:hypothetical protein